MIPYGFHPEAEDELLEAVRFYEERGEGLGQRLLGEVREAIALIREHPEIAPVTRGVFRAKTLKRFPYNLIYVCETWGIEIYAVMHQRRRPGYWRSRRKRRRP